MRTIKSGNSLPIPEGCTITIKKREVKVTGPRGSLTRSFTHAPIDLKIDEKKNAVVAEIWFGKKLEVSTIKSVLSHISNMFTGVTIGYKYKMRFAYAHFPVGVTVEGNEVQIRNFLGEKYIRKVTALGDAKAYRTEASTMKDELVIEGNDITEVSQTAASVHGVCLVKRKDIRKFLDGIYVSHKGSITGEL